MKTNWPALRNGCLILASLACSTAPLLAQSQAGTGEAANAAVISSVAVTQASQRASVSPAQTPPIPSMTCSPVETAAEDH